MYAMSVARKLIRLTMITLLAVTTSAASAVDLTALCGDHHLPHAQHDHDDDATDGCDHAHTRAGDLGHQDNADGCGCMLGELPPTETIPLTRPAPVRDGLASPLPCEASHLADLHLASLSITGATPATTARTKATPTRSANDALPCRCHVSGAAHLRDRSGAQRRLRRFSLVIMAPCRSCARAWLSGRRTSQRPCEPTMRVSGTCHLRCRCAAADRCE